MKNLKIRLGIFSLLAILAVSVFLTSCEQEYIPTTEDSSRVGAYITLLGDENASLEEAHELYLSLNSQELIEANNIIIEKTIEQARQENDKVALNFFTQNQSTFSKFYSAIESQAVELYGISFNQLDRETLEGLYEIEINKLDFVPFEEVQDEEIIIEYRSCPSNHFPIGVCRGGSMFAPSNFFFYGKRHGQWQWWCNWVFNFPSGYYTKVNSHNWYVKGVLVSFGCSMKARHISGETQLILDKTRFALTSPHWIQSQLRMAW